MKILIAGLGAIGQRHLRNLHSILGDTAQFSAYRVRRLSHALTERMEVQSDVDVEKKFGITIFDHFATALDQKPDLVLICNPSSLHMSLALAAARAGCHLFLEKPLSDSLDHVDELIQIVKEKELVALVGYQMRFHPCLVHLRELLERQAIGNLIAVRVENGENLPSWHPYEDYRQSYAARAELGGGVILTQIHELDYLYAAFGMPETLYAVGGHLSRLEVTVEDTASILMQCRRPDGALFPIHIHQDYLQLPPVRTCQVLGDAGAIYLDLRAFSAKLLDAAGHVVEIRAFENFNRNQMFLDEMRHLLRCIARQEKPLVSLADASASLKLALTAKKSITMGQVINLT